MNYKKLFEYIKIVVLTSVLFIAGLYFIDRLVTPAGNMEAFYDEPENTIDVLVVGGSHSMCSVSATEMYKQTGLTTYNLNTWSQPVWVSYHYIVEALKYQSPKVIVLDIFGSFYDRSYLTGVDVDLVSDDFAQLLKPSLNLLSLNLTRRLDQVSPKVWSEYLNIVKYHSRITELTKEDFDKIFKDDSTSSKGFGPMYTIEDFSDYVYPSTENVEQLYPAAEKWLRKLIDLTNKEGIKLVMLKIPHIADEKDIALVNRIHEISRETGVDFIDCCSENVMGLDFSQDFADHGHMNNYGAKKLTSYLADYINSLGIESRQNRQVKERWDNFRAVEQESMTKFEVRIAKSFAELVQRAQKHEPTSLIIANQRGNLTDEDYTAIYNLFKNTPFECDTEILKNSDLFVLTDGQLLTGAQAESWCAENEITVNTDNKAEIIYNGENYSFMRDGLNLAAFDTKGKEVYHYISFAKEHNWTPYTR